jgi:RNA polymerase sigma-70 factor (ECF subfamily)
VDTQPPGDAGVDGPTDDELMLRARDGEADALAALFERYQGPLYSFFVRMTSRSATSEDLVQETFLRVMRSKHTYRSTGRFKAWLYQVARSAHSDHYRKRWREQPLGEDEESVPSTDSELGDRIEVEEQRELVRAALDRLPPEKREVLVLSRYQGLKYEEIGRILGCPEGTVKVRVHRAMKALRDTYLHMTKDRVR